MKHAKSGCLAAGLATSCCLLPLLLAMVGLGGSVLTAVLVQYKAYLMAVAFAALVYAWVHYARDATQCASQACALVGGRLRKWLLGVNTGMVVLVFLLTYTPVSSLAHVVLSGSSDPARAPGGPLPLRSAERLHPGTVVKASGAPGEPTRMEQLALRVEGMT